MSSSTLATLHLVTVQLFLLLYIVKTFLLLANKKMLEKMVRITKVPEMIISTLFLVTGIWLLFILGAIKMLIVIKLILVFVSIPVSIVAFKKQKKLLSLLSLVLILGAYGLGEAAKKKPFIPTKVEVVGDADDDAKLGVKTFIANCAMCHGKDGMKMYRDATNLTLSGMDQTSIEIRVREGTPGNWPYSKAGMPAFGKTLNEEEIIAVSAYVQTLRK